MDLNTINKLKFRRQYFISPRPIQCPFIHQSINLTSTWVLYVHIDLITTIYTTDNLKIVLLGDIFDYENSKNTNSGILKDISSNDFKVVLKNLSLYTGSYILIHVLNDTVNIVTDATATKKIFYCRNQEGVWCSSQPHLMAKILGLKPSEENSKRLYYQSQRFHLLNNANIGDTTIYDDVYQVLPNHFINVNKFEITRFWPQEKMISKTVQETVYIVTKLIKGYVESIGNRYEIMLPVTAGKDSRTLMAATYDIRNETFYYLNKETRLKDTSTDIRTAKKLFKKLNLDFHLIDPYIDMDEDFKRIYYENNPYASSFYLPIIYNYYVNFGDKVNLPGNIATGSVWYYKILQDKCTVKDLVEEHNLASFKHAWRTYAKWLEGCKYACDQNNYKIWCLFYWEERLGNWGTQIQLDKDIAQVDINPYNSRMLIDSILSVKPLHAVEFGTYPVNAGIIKNLWPELLTVPMNPGLRNHCLFILEILGMKGLLFNYMSRY